MRDIHEVPIENVMFLKDSNEGKIGDKSGRGKSVVLTYSESKFSTLGSAHNINSSVLMTSPRKRDSREVGVSFSARSI